MKAERDFDKEFKEWYILKWIPENRPDYLKYHGHQIWGKWGRKSFSEQYGVYLRFFDEKGIKIDVEWYQESVFTSCVHTEEKGYQPIRFDHYTREEAQKTCIKKAKQIFNQNRNNNE